MERKWKHIVYWRFFRCVEASVQVNQKRLSQLTNRFRRIKSAVFCSQMKQMPNGMQQNKKERISFDICTCKMKVDTHKSVGVYFFRSKIREKGGIGMGKKGTP
ncbi:hypothetical protein, partial [Merdimmobilis hominis]|uniref:hypothetical protein n=1 Tax=Merdimmobilis hominis TaxID=2897707 RepID=UPI00195D5D6E